MIASNDYRNCSRCSVSKPLSEYGTFATKPGRKKVCQQCLEVMHRRLDLIKQGLPVPPRRYGPKPKAERKPKVVHPEPVIIPTDGIAWPATTNPLFEVKS